MTLGIILAAQDPEDLQVLSARLQDAVAQVRDLVWLPKAQRFAAVFNRFKWEDAGRKRGAALRVRAGLSFERVTSAKSHKIRYDNPKAVLSLLAIRFEPRGEEDPGGAIELLFSGGGVIRLEVECVEASLSDIGSEWPARRKPTHPLAG